MAWHSDRQRPLAPALAPGPPAAAGVHGWDIWRVDARHVGERAHGLIDVRRPGVSGLPSEPV